MKRIVIFISLHIFLISSNGFDDSKANQTRGAITRLSDKMSIHTNIMYLTLKNIHENVSMGLEGFNDIRFGIKKIIEDSVRLHELTQKKDGSLVGINNLIQVLQELQYMNTQLAEKNILGKIIDYPSFISQYITVLGIIDNIKIEHLILPVVDILKQASFVFKKTLQVNQAYKFFGNFVLSEKRKQIMQKIIVEVDSISLHLFDIADSGKKKIRSLQMHWNLLWQLIKHREKLPQLIKEFESLEIDIFPYMDQFDNLLAISNANVDAIIDFSKGFSRQLGMRLNIRKEESLTGLIGPRVIFKETSAIVQIIKTKTLDMIENFANALGAINHVIKIAVDKLIIAPDTYIQFTILNAKALTSAQSLPESIHNLVFNIQDLIASFR